MINIRHDWKTCCTQQELSVQIPVSNFQSYPFKSLCRTFNNRTKDFWLTNNLWTRLSTKIIWKYEAGIATVQWYIINARQTKGTTFIIIIQCHQRLRCEIWDWRNTHHEYTLKWEADILNNNRQGSLVFEYLSVYLFAIDKRMDIICTRQMSSC